MYCFLIKIISQENEKMNKRWGLNVLIVFAIAILITITGCRVKDIKEVTIKVPGMKNATCAKIIQDAFMKQPGLEEVRPDISNRTVYIKYNSMVIAKKNLEYTITSAGFDANNEKADPEAYKALPPECK